MGVTVAACSSMVDKSPLIDIFHSTQYAILTDEVTKLLMTVVIIQNLSATFVLSSAEIGLSQS